MVLIRDGRLSEDRYTDVSGEDSVTAQGSIAQGPIIVSLEQWQSDRESLQGRELGIRLASDQPPELIADDLEHFSVVALEFPVFRDGRAYSYARILRDTYGFEGELRAVGEVLLEQLHFMIRVGFDAFEMQGDDPEAAYKIAAEEFSAWYQPGADARATAMQLRMRNR